MKCLDLTLPEPAENLACDEALLDLCETDHTDEVLRFWESPALFVVLGFANQAAREVFLPRCRERQIPVLRRCSGGGTVLQGPGCLNYSLVLRADRAPDFATVTGTNRTIMQRHAALFQKLLGRDVQVQGHTDLVVDRRKFSGNAQRRRRLCLLFHGTFLLKFDLAQISDLLPAPSKEPDYRVRRPHQEFLTNLDLSAASLKSRLCRTWGVSPGKMSIPTEAIQTLVNEKYAREEWNLRV